MKEGIADKACEILRLTHDGNDLLSWQLKYLEDAVNDRLNDRGYQLFDLLLERVRAGTYRQFFVEEARAYFLS